MAALTETEVSQLYIGVFGRASEGEGNQYWQSAPGINGIIATADAMLNTEATRTYFGANFNSNQNFIEHIYANTLGKTSAEDPDGIAYWVSELNGGKARGEVVVALIDATQSPLNVGAAQDRFDNKVAVSNYCAESIATFTNMDLFSGFVSDVTDSSQTVVSAKSFIEQEKEIFLSDADESFFPIPSDAEPSLTWRYRINNSEAVEVYSEGTYLHMLLGDLTLIINHDPSSSESIRVTYWVAEGIGMIKGSGQYQILGTPLALELIETNLRQ